MAVRIIAGGFIMLAVLAACAMKPKPASPPTKLERTCPFEGAWMPCFIVDEALQPQWSI